MFMSTPLFIRNMAIDLVQNPTVFPLEEIIKKMSLLSLFENDTSSGPVKFETVQFWKSKEGINGLYKLGIAWNSTYEPRQRLAYGSYMTLYGLRPKRDLGVTQKYVRMI